MTEHDVFISYATEDNNFATEIAYGLKANGLSVWFAPVSLVAGQKLLDSIERGLNSSRAGLLILSPQYLKKDWTNYEMDILIRQYIDGKKTLLPIWHGLTKLEIEARHFGLSGIVGICNTDIKDVLSKLIEALSLNAHSRGVIPSWENPSYRFLNGLGEVNLQTSDGPATSIYELLVHSKDTDFPFWLAGKSYTKIELLLHVAQIIGPDPDRIKGWVQEEGYKKLCDMCIENNLDPTFFY